MLTANFVIINYLLLILAFLVVFLFGHIITSLFKSKPGFDSLFLKITIGILLIPTTYAIIKTGGETVLVFNVFLAMVFVAMNFRDVAWKDYTSKLLKLNKELLPSIVFLTIVYFLNLYALFDFTDGSFRSIHPDYVFYAKLAGYLRDFGIENVYVEYYIDPLRVNNPYHFTELWLTAVISDVFKLHVQYSLYLVAYSLIYVCVYTGFITLIHKVWNRIFGKEEWIIWIFSALFFVVGMFIFLYPDSIEILEQDLWTNTIISIPKLSIIYVFLIWMIILIRNQSYFAASLVCCLTAINYTMVTPGLFLAFGTLLIFRVWTKADSFKVLLWNFTPMLVTAALLLIFYFGKSDTISIVVENENSNLFSFLKISTSINIFIKTSLQIIFTSFPYLLILFYLRKEMFSREKEITFFWILLIVFSLLSWMLFNVSVDAVQLWANLYIPASNIFGCLLLVVLYKKTVKQPIMKYAVVISMMLINLIYFSPLSNPNPKLADIDIAELPEKKSPHFAYIRDEQDYVAFYMNNELIYGGQIYGLVRKYDPLFITCISNDVVYSEDRQMIMLHANTTFPRYYFKRDGTSRYPSLAEGQQHFIVEKQIDYLLVSRKRKLPEQFFSLFDPVSIGVIDGYSVYKRLNSIRVNSKSKQI